MGVVELDHVRRNAVEIGCMLARGAKTLAEDAALFFAAELAAELHRDAHFLGLHGAERAADEIESQHLGGADHLDR